MGPKGSVRVLTAGRATRARAQGTNRGDDDFVVRLGIWSWTLGHRALELPPEAARLWQVERGDARAGRRGRGEVARSSGSSTRRRRMSLRYAAVNGSLRGRRPPALPSYRLQIQAEGQGRARQEQGLSIPSMKKGQALKEGCVSKSTPEASAGRASQQQHAPPPPPPRRARPPAPASSLPASRRAATPASPRPRARSIRTTAGHGLHASAGAHVAPGFPLAATAGLQSAAPAPDRARRQQRPPFPVGTRLALSFILARARLAA